MESDIINLISGVQQLQMIRYLEAAIFTVFVVDYLHTFAAEVNSLWPAPWTIVKALFLISRYSPFLDGPIILAVAFVSSPSVDVCTHLLRAQVWSCGIGETCSQLLLLYRVYALVGRVRLSAILLSLLALIIVTDGFLFASLIQGSIKPAGANTPSNFPKCTVSETNLGTGRLNLVVPLDTIAIETIFFGVIYWAKVKKYKEDDNWLVRKIYRDAFMYYLLLLVTAAISLLMWFSPRGSVRQVSSTWLRYIASIISSRIILNIRQYANIHRTYPEAGPTGTRGGETSQPASGLRFASGSNQTISAIDTELRIY